ncbi:hypothetical protein [Bradyrhizobium sp. Cp5.3]|uniref:hypothetical protein n=1 Tax=Bradyrhizobium sp. Cp5.3 TaxID=443598 RepID=UPI0006840A5E|nr:hypothetical protein [Bradyrhizobium sp. Cp5.3]
MQAQRRVCTNLRDKLSNGTRLMPGVDLRSPSGRRFRYLLAAYAEELGGALSEADQALLRQAVGLQLQSEKLQADIVKGAPVDTDQLVRISSEARRALATLRTKADRRKPEAESVADYVARKYGGAAEAETSEAT